MLAPDYDSASCDGIYINRCNIEGASSGDLYGLRFVVKDFTQVIGLPLTFGLKDPLLKKADGHSESVKLFLDSGATLLGTTNMDVAALGYSGHNPYYSVAGQQANILGSSFGAALALQKGDCDFALTSDFAGSTRLPAATSGLFGLKLSPDALPRAGSVLYDDRLDCFGFISGDLNIMERALHPLSSDTHCAPPSRVLMPAAKELAHLTQEAVSGFETLCEKFKLPISVLPDDFFSDIFQMREDLYPEPILRTLKQHQIDDPALEALRSSLEILSTKSHNLSSLATKKEKIRELISGSIIVTPTLYEANSSHLNYYLLPANVLGLPAITIPRESFPVQIIGPAHSEQKLIELTHALT